MHPTAEAFASMIHGDGARCLVLTRTGAATPRVRRAGKAHLTQLLLVQHADGAVSAASLHGGQALKDAALDEAIAMTSELHGDRLVSGVAIAPATQDALDTFLRWTPALAAAVGAFESELDPSLIAAAPGRLPARYATYSWLVRQPPVEAARIAQAAIAYPFLWTLLGGEDRRGASSLLARLRAAEPASDLIGTMLAARPWQVRALREAAVAGHLAEEDLSSVGELVALSRGLDAMPPERAPRTRAGWQYLRRLVASLDHKAWIRDLADVGLDALALGRGVPRSWRSFARISGLRRQLSDIRDFYSYAADFADQQWLPRDHDQSLRRVVEAQTRWKSIVDPEGTARVPADQDRRPAPSHLAGHWDPVIGGPVTLGDVVIHALASVDDLREEGFLMKHCIATYARICEEKGSRIFSLRDTAGERLSTLQILRINGTWRVLQHRGKANGPVPARCKRLAEAFVVTLSAS